MYCNGKKILSVVRTVTVVDDITQITKINADLDATSATTATRNQLYRHNGASAKNYKIGTLYYTNGTNWVEF